MRTVLVHLQGTTEVQIENYFGRTYPNQKGPPWICPIGEDPCLYINIYRDIQGEFEPEDISNLQQELGGSPTVSVRADVSGRHPGDEQVRDFVLKILSEFQGVAQDDFTEGFWTEDDIRLDRRKTSSVSANRDERTFFDYRSRKQPEN